MLTTVSIDDKLLARAKELSGIAENALVIEEALALLIQREAARKIIALGGSQPGAKVPPRRRWSDDGKNWEGNPE